MFPEPFCILFDLLITNKIKQLGVKIDEKVQACVFSPGQEGK